LLLLHLFFCSLCVKVSVVFLEDFLMDKNKVIGLVLLCVFALSLLGCIFNGTFADLSSKSFSYYLGFFTALGAVFGVGLMFLFKKSDK